METGSVSDLARVKAVASGGRGGAAAAVGLGFGVGIRFWSRPRLLSRFWALGRLGFGMGVGFGVSGIKSRARLSITSVDQ